MKAKETLYERIAKVNDADIEAAKSQILAETSFTEQQAALLLSALFNKKPFNKS